MKKEKGGLEGWWAGKGSYPPASALSAGINNKTVPCEGQGTLGEKKFSSLGPVETVCPRVAEMTVKGKKKKILR